MPSLMNRILFSHLHLHLHQYTSQCTAANIHTNMFLVFTPFTLSILIVLADKQPPVGMDTYQ
ncbi:hypothetical protein Hanom_Chr04g00279731 [Helianthus anomalus]